MYSFGTHRKCPYCQQVFNTNFAHNCPVSLRERDIIEARRLLKEWLGIEEE